MDYQNTLKYLYESAPMFQQIGSKAYKPGLETTHKLDEHFGHPHQQFKTIHIAGTNGKGSCSHTIAAVLQSARDCSPRPTCRTSANASASTEK